LLRDRLERKLDFEAMKFDIMSLKANIDKRQTDTIVSLKKEPDLSTR
jgi:hypothetical protein